MYIFLSFFLPYFRCLPLSELWAILVYVASEQTGTQRLKTIQLLLKILQTQHRYSNNKTRSADCTRSWNSINVLNELTIYCTRAWNSPNVLNKLTIYCTRLCNSPNVLNELTIYCTRSWNSPNVLNELTIYCTRSCNSPNVLNELTIYC